MTAKLPDSERTRASLELLYSISRELTSELDLSELLQRILKLTIEKVAATSGSIIVIDENGRLSEGALFYDGKVIDHTTETLEDPFDRGLAGWVFENRKPAFISSTLDDERWLQRTAAEADEESRSAISVPLILRDRVVGVLTTVHSQVEYFSEDDLTLLQAIADQASVAVENARLFAAEQERRRFASTLQEIARTINSTLDSAQVFSEILDQLARLITYDSASIFVVEGDDLVLVAGRGFQDENAILGLKVPIETNTLSSVVLKTVEPLFVEDVQLDERWINLKKIPELGKIRGWIGAPLIVRDRAMGVLNIDSYSVGAFDLKQLDLVTAFAEQAATAVANAQLFADSRRRVQALFALAHTAQVVTESLNMDELIERILKRTLSSLDAEAASVALLDEATDTLEFKFVRGKAAEHLVGLRLKRGQGIAGWVVENNEPVVILDVKEDSRFYPRIDSKTGFETHSIAAAPILAESKTIGVLEAINPRSDVFREEQIDLLMGIAFLAGSAIIRAGLFSEIQSAQQRYASLFEDSIDPLLITNLKGSIKDANRHAERFLDCSRETLREQSVFELGIPSADRVESELAQLEPGETYSSEPLSAQSEDQALPIEIHIKRIDIDQEPMFQWILRDVSERIELEQLRSDLTSMIFHDLRAPIGNIISSLEVLETSKMMEDEAFQSVLSIAQRSSRRASRLIESLLDLDRLEAGDAVINKQKVSISDLIVDAIEEVKPMAEAKEHVLESKLKPNLPEVEIDFDLILRVITNLLENAIKYTRTGGAIIISARKEKKHILVSVKDSGSGIPVADQQRIFDKYARIHRKGKPKGRGLGLAFCRLAIEAHGGKIWVESLEGEGSTFHFTLPL